MNNRFDDLMYKSGLTAQGCWDEMDSYDQAAILKFAELIVKECVGVPYTMWDRAELNADVAVKIDRRIKDHFGIEDEE